MESREQTHDQPRRALGDGNLLNGISEISSRNNVPPSAHPNAVAIHKADNGNRHPKQSRGHCR
jgi:hypothetical protein